MPDAICECDRRSRRRAIEPILKIERVYRTLGASRRRVSHTAAVLPFVREAETLHAAWKPRCAAPISPRPDVPGLGVRFLISIRRLITTGLDDVTSSCFSFGPCEEEEEVEEEEESRCIRALQSDASQTSLIGLSRKRSMSLR